MMVKTLEDVTGTKGEAHGLKWHSMRLLLVRIFVMRDPCVMAHQLPDFILSLGNNARWAGFHTFTISARIGIGFGHLLFSLTYPGNPS